MQILDQNVSEGKIKVQIDCLNDLWELYNIIREGDYIAGNTFRRVVVREGEAGERRPMYLKIHVEKVEFHEFSNRVRVLGSIVEGPADIVSIGQHHTFNLEINDRISIYKDKWYDSDLKRIKNAISLDNAKHIFIIGIDKGYSILCLLTNYSLNQIAEVEENIPGKHYAKQEQNKALESFYNSVFMVVQNNISKFDIGAIVIAGPGYFKEEFLEFLKQEFKKIGKQIPLYAINASSSELSAIYEILNSGKLATVVSNHKMALESKYMQMFIESMGKNDGKCAYGIEDVKNAANQGAVEYLLVLDTAIRSADPNLRSAIEEILNAVEVTRGTVIIVSSQNPAGETLRNYGEIIALLRYKVDYSEETR
jgi:protein pelota